MKACIFKSEKKKEKLCILLLTIINNGFNIRKRTQGVPFKNNKSILESKGVKALGYQAFAFYKVS